MHNVHTHSRQRYNYKFRIVLSYNSVHIYDCHNVNILYNHHHSLTLKHSLYQRSYSYPSLQSEPNANLAILSSSPNVHLTVISFNPSITSIYHNLQLINIIITISSPNSQPIHAYKNKQGIHEVLHSTQCKQRTHLILETRLFFY